MNHQIEYSPEEMLRSLDKQLDELNALRYDSNYSKVLGSAFVERCSDWERDIRKCRENPFTVVVVGDFKRGKSTFINALLGQEVVTTDVTTETVSLNRISYGATESNEAMLSGSRRVRLSDRELKREELEKLAGELGEPVRRLELKRPCEILKKVTIIDTPGTGDAMKDFSEMVRESLLQADVVIYLYNAMYPLSRTEQLFLRSAILPQKHTSLLLVANYGDMLGSVDGYDRMEKMLQERTQALLPGEKSYLISALDELERRLGEEPLQTELSDRLHEQFMQLSAELERLVQEKADTVVIDRMQRMTSGMVQELGQELDALDAGLTLDAGQAAARMQEMEQKRQAAAQLQKAAVAEIHDAIGKMKNETSIWMGDLVQRIMQDAQTLETIPPEDIKRYYELFCLDTMQQGLTGCVEYHEDQLYDLLEKQADGLGETVIPELHKDRRYGFRVKVDNRVWTKGDTVSLVTSNFQGLNLYTFVGGIVTDAIAGAMREKEVKKRAPELAAQIRNKLPVMNASIAQTITSVYGELQEKAEKLIAEYYDTELQNAEHLYSQTAQAAGMEQAEKEQMKEVIAKARQLLANVSGSL